MDLSLDDFILLRDLIYEKTGIFLEEKKLYFLRTRAISRAEATNCTSIKEYYRFLKYQNSDDELKKILNLVTTNETYFFRDTMQMSAFSDELLISVIAEKMSKNDKTLRIWSSACSTGDEPYTIAILLKEYIKNIKEWHIEIMASDINTEVLKKCEEGIYSQRAVKDVPANLLNKYFKQNGNDYALSDDVKKMVTLKRINLFDSDQVRRLRNFDFIFCRNVLIYFDDKAKKKVINDFFDILNKSGYILLGVGESLGRISASFKLVKLKHALVYQK